ncbi:MAG: DUF3298 domain-containing protein, partial [Bacillota bacterium]|nr:DUF3298 domain-containing protein [Bacillota bacterium]
KDGSLIWRQDDIKYSFSGGIKVKNHYDRINYFTDVEYPEILGISDKATQDNINAEIKKLFLTSQAPEEPSDEPENADATNSTTYTVNINKNLLLIEKTGYYFPTGAAHGMPSDETYHIDLKTGAVYQLKNLFKSNSKFTERLTALVAKQIQLNLKITDESLAYTYFDTKPAVGENIGFRINKDCLSVYFAPYDIAAYACGFVTFNIPYGQISDIIDAKSAFWNSFDKIIKNSKINLIGDISDSLSTQIQNAMKNYETQIISAINTNDFKKVEPTLLKDSSLYTSQKKLVSDLFKKGIKESLGSYDIYAIGYSYNEDVFKVYTTESIAVKTPPSKSYITKKFSWCYSVKVDTKTKTCKLCKIEKW